LLAEQEHVFASPQLQFPLFISQNICLVEWPPLQAPLFPLQMQTLAESQLQFPLLSSQRQNSADPQLQAPLIEQVKFPVPLYTEQSDRKVEEQTVDESRIC